VNETDANPVVVVGDDKGLLTEMRARTLDAFVVSAQGPDGRRVLVWPADNRTVAVELAQTAVGIAGNGEEVASSADDIELAEAMAGCGFTDYLLAGQDEHEKFVIFSSSDRLKAHLLLVPLLAALLEARADK